MMRLAATGAAIHHHGLARADWSAVAVSLECGLKEPSAINLHHIVTVPKAGLRRFVGSVPPAVLAQVHEAMLFALGFSR